MLLFFLGCGLEIAFRTQNGMAVGDGLLKLGGHVFRSRTIGQGL